MLDGRTEVDSPTKVGLLVALVPGIEARAPPTGGGEAIQGLVALLGLRRPRALLLRLPSLTVGVRELVWLWGIRVGVGVVTRPDVLLLAALIHNVLG
eukprot:10318036-Alexandrium_andersonii.AAC.1